MSSTTSGQNVGSCSNLKRETTTPSTETPQTRGLALSTVTVTNWWLRRQMVSWVMKVQPSSNAPKPPPTSGGSPWARCRGST